MMHSISRKTLTLTCAKAISAAPPPGTNLGSRRTLRATCIASCRLRSTSLSTSLDAPRSRTVQALGSSHSITKQKYSSPIYFRMKKVFAFINLKHITYFLDFEETSFSANILFTKFVSSVNDGSTRSTSNAIIIRFPDTTNSCNSGL